MHSTPATLLERLRQPHDVAAWGRFVELYSPLLFHWSRRLGLQSSDAADLVQDVFLLLVRKLPAFQYDPQRSFHAWLKTLFLNQHRQRQRLRVPASLEKAIDVPAPAAQEDQEDRRYLTQRALRLVEKDFSPLMWKAFQEYALSGRPPAEVARELGLSPGTVYSVKSKVLHRLRREFEFLLAD